MGVTMKKKIILSISVAAVCIILIFTAGILKTNISKSVVSSNGNINKNISNEIATKESKNTTSNTTDAASNTAANTTVANSAAANSTENIASTDNSSKQNNGAVTNTTSKSNTTAASSNGAKTETGSNNVVETPKTPEPPVKAKINITIKNGITGEVILSMISFDFDDSVKTAGDATLKALSDKRISKKTSGEGSTLYFSSIHGLTEKDARYGSNSGWIYYVNRNGNEEAPNVSCGAYPLQAGDTVTWVYSSN